MASVKGDYYLSNRNNREVAEFIKTFSNLAKAVKEDYPNSDIRVIDTKTASIGSVLKINPVMRLINGEVTITEKIREKSIIQIVQEEVEQIEKQILGVGYSENPGEGEELLGRLQNNFNPKQIHYRPIGASIASHAGLGTLGIAYLSKYD